MPASSTTTLKQRSASGARNAGTITSTGAGNSTSTAGDYAADVAPSSPLVDAIITAPSRALIFNVIAIAGALKVLLNEYWPDQQRQLYGRKEEHENDKAIGQEHVMNIHEAVNAVWSVKTLEKSLRTFKCHAAQNICSISQMAMLDRNRHMRKQETKTFHMLQLKN